MRLSEECEGQSDDDGCDGALAHGYYLTHVDRDLDVGRCGCDDGAVGTAGWVRVAVQELAWFRRWQQSGLTRIRTVNIQYHGWWEQHPWRYWWRGCSKAMVR